MGVFNFDDETTSVVAPSRLYKALVTDSDNLIPKVIDAIQSIEIVEGNGGAGTIKKLTFVEGGETKYDLHKVDLVDDVNFAYNYSIVGGGGLPDTVEKISFESKLSAGPDGGSIAKLTVKYFTKGDAAPSEEEIKGGKARGDGLFKALEAVKGGKMDLKLLVRVAHIWLIHDKENPYDIIFMNMILVDEKRGRIHATVRKFLVPTMQNMIEEGGTYKLENVLVGFNEGNYKLLPHKHKFTMMGNPRFTKVNASNLPRNVFEFMDFKDILSSQEEDVVALS